MAIAHAGGATSADLNAPGATVALTKPTGSSASDVLIAVFGSGRGASGVGTWTAPSGWTQIGSTQTAANSQPRSISLQVWWSLGGNTSLTFTKSGTVDAVGWVCLRFTGVDTTAPVDSTATGNTNTASTSLLTNGPTIANNGSWRMTAFGDWLGGTFSASGFTNVQNVGTNETAALLFLASDLSVGATASVSVSSTLGPTNQILAAQPFALRPSVVAQTPGKPFPSLPPAMLAM